MEYGEIYITDQAYKLINDQKLLAKPKLYKDNRGNYYLAESFNDTEQFIELNIDDKIEKVGDVSMLSSQGNIYLVRGDNFRNNFPLPFRNYVIAENIKTIEKHYSSSSIISIQLIFNMEKEEYES